MTIKHIENMTFELTISDYVWFDDIPGISLTYDEMSKSALEWAKQNCKTLVIHQIESEREYGKPMSFISFSCEQEAMEFSLRWRN